MTGLAFTVDDQHRMIAELWPGPERSHLDHWKAWVLHNLPAYTFEIRLLTEDGRTLEVHHWATDETGLAPLVDDGALVELSTTTTPPEPLPTYVLPYMTINPERPQP